MRRQIITAMIATALIATLPFVAGADDQTAAVEAPELEEPADEPVEANHPQLEEAIDTLLADPELQRTDIGIHVEDLNTGEVLYTRGADQQMNPASNVKLLTAAVVLDQLGPHHTFETDLSTNSRDGSTINDLFVRGEGEAFLLYEHVLRWASDLRRQGIETIQGDLIVDDGVFAEAYLPPGFDLKDSGASYRSPIGAVSVNFNAVTVEVEPADAPGQPPSVSVDPPNSYVEIDNRARTVYGTRPNIHVRSDPEGDATRLTIQGTIGTDVDSIAQRRRIDNPPAFAGSVVAEAMNTVGIDFSGDIRRGAAPDDNRQLMVHQSRPVLESIWAMNKWSNNFIAEQLLRVVGGIEDNPSTWDAARSTATETLARYGLQPGTYHLNNGSGLYEGNEVSPRQIVRLLQQMNDHHYGPEFASSLAIAGVDGTLAHRLDDDSTKGKLRGKTGTLNEVSALSGYVDTAGGRTVAFSILFNDPPRRAWNYRSDQDDIARAIAKFEQ